MNSYPNSARDGQSAATPERGSKPAPFFRLNARYLIDPASSAEQVAADIPCLFEALEGVLQAVIDNTTSDKSLSAQAFAALYLTQQLSGMFDGYRDRATAHGATLAPDVGGLQ